MTTDRSNHLLKLGGRHVLKNTAQMLVDLPTEVAVAVVMVVGGGGVGGGGVCGSSVV
jgi:hypothetical protein